MKNLVIEDAALQELRKAEKWFDDIAPSLRDRFVGELFKVIDTIQSYPEMFRLVDSRVRRANLTVFPWYVIYAVREDNISILAIAHAKRRPGYWRKRNDR